MTNFAAKAVSQKKLPINEYWTLITYWLVISENTITWLFVHEWAFSFKRQSLSQLFHSLWEFYYNCDAISKRKFTEKSDCIFWEGNSEVTILSKVMIVKLNESVNCFFHRAQLDKSRSAIIPEVQYKPLLILTKFSLQRQHSEVTNIFSATSHTHWTLVQWKNEN